MQRMTGVALLALVGCAGGSSAPPNAYDSQACKQARAALNMTLTMMEAQRAFWRNSGAQSTFVDLAIAEQDAEVRQFKSERSECFKTGL